MLPHLLLGALAVWRLTHLFQAEDGPGHVLARLRRAAKGGFAGELLDCFYCLSLWIAAPFAWALSDAWRERLLLLPALSGAAILLERLASRAESHSPAPPALYEEDDVPPEALLRPDGDPVDPARDPASP